MAKEQDIQRRHKMETSIGEKKLLCAVIEQAYMDATGQGCGKRFMMDAQEWLKSDGDSPFSYIWICEELQIDPSIIRRAISRNICAGIILSWPRS